MAEQPVIRWGRTPQNTLYHAHREGRDRSLCGGPLGNAVDLPAGAIRPDTLPYCGTCETRAEQAIRGATTPADQKEA